MPSSQVHGVSQLMYASGAIRTRWPWNGLRTARIGFCLIGLLAAIFVVPAVAEAVPVNDNRANALPLQLGIASTISNTDATTEPHESFTADDPSHLYCSNTTGPDTTKGVRMDRTLWWQFTGDGGPITVSSDESNINFDTVLAIYEKSNNLLLGCNDDVQPEDPARPDLEGVRFQSEMTINTVVGREYLVQVGGCTSPLAPPPRCPPVTTGAVKLRVSGTPSNDSRSTAIPIVAGGAALTTNTGATLEGGEPASCGSSLYAKTIWFRYHAPAIGTASVSVAGAEGVINTVLAVYSGNSATALGCNDDAIANTLGSSSLPSIQPAGATVHVAPGDYFIQIGGFHHPGFSTVSARHGPLSVQVQFTEDTDIDNDGIQRDVDCNDNDPAIRPGSAEIPNNPVDENCDGIKAEDIDGDGALAPSAGNDCNDRNAAIRPGADEVAGNAIDENCDNIVEPPPALDFVFSLAWKHSADKTHITRLLAKKVPAGTTIVVRCLGKGCRKQSRRIVVKRQRNVSLLQTLRGTLRRPVPKPLMLRAGTRIDLRATRAGHIGKRQVYRFFRKKAPTSRVSCLPPPGLPGC